MAPRAGSISQVKHLDPDGLGGYSVHDEVNMRDLMCAELAVPIHNTLATHNRVYSFVHPFTGNKLHIRLPRKFPGRGSSKVERFYFV